MSETCPRCNSATEDVTEEGSKYHECDSVDYFNGTSFISTECRNRELAALRAQLADSQRMREEAERDCSDYAVRLSDCIRAKDELQGHYDRDTAKLKQEIVRLNAANSGVYWRWIGDGSDYLDSLTCPILIDVGQLHEILSVNLAATARAEAAEARVEGLEGGINEFISWTIATDHDYFDKQVVRDTLRKILTGIFKRA